VRLGIRVVLGLGYSMLLCGCASSRTLIPNATNREVSHREAIDKVMQRFKAVSEAAESKFAVLKQNPIKGTLSGSLGEAIQEIANNLAKIDLSQCPEDFRLAFVNYRHELLLLKDYADSVTGWSGAVKGFTAFVTADLKAFTSISDNVEKAAIPLKKATRELELVCAKYNVDPNK
jgi:hypothetical protein